MPLLNLKLRPSDQAPVRSRASARMQDWLLDRIAPVQGIDAAPKAELPQDEARFRHIAFTFALMALAVKLAKRDGNLSREAYLALYELFPLADDDCPKLRRLLALAWEDSGTPEQYARQILYLYPNRKVLHKRVVEHLCRIAGAEGTISGTKLRYVREVAEMFGLSRREMGQLLDACQDAQPQPLEVLGLPAQATKDVIKRRYHELMKRYHPDKVMASARFPETIALSLKRAAEINAAYRALC